MCVCLVRRDPPPFPFWVLQGRGEPGFYTKTIFSSHDGGVEDDELPEAMPDGVPGT